MAITGQVPSWAIGSDAFQEADTTGITMPVTKHNELVLDIDRIPGAVAEAFHIASTGRPGPVLVDIAKDALQAKAAFQWPVQLDLPGTGNLGAEVRWSEAKRMGIQFESEFDLRRLSPGNATFGAKLPPQGYTNLKYADGAIDKKALSAADLRYR